MGRPDGDVVMTADASRRTAAIAMSLAVHAAALALLVGQGRVRLTLVPAPVLLTLVEAADRTAGPGESSAQLRSAAPGEALAAAAKTVAPIPEPARAEAPREKPLEPPAARAPQPRPATKKTAPPSRPEPARAGEEAAVASSSASASAAGGGGTGADARSSAPAWAPAARVRYEELLFSWMERHKQYPMLAERRGLEGSGAVRVRIDREGRVLERSLDKSTGEAMLDQAVLDMVRRANPFPRVPAEYAGSSFEFIAPIEYRLR